MEKYLNILKKSDFFRQIPNDTIISIVQSDVCYLKNYTAGTTIYECGQNISFAGIVLEGEIDVIHSSADGTETIVNRFAPASTFGASFSCVEYTNTLNNFRSITPSTILFININGLLHKRYKQCEHYVTLIENIMFSLASSNIRLNTKIQVLTQKTLRDKLLTYFESLATQNNSREFTLSFNREQLAGYLGSERSSICRELSKLAEEQLIKINRNQIILLT